MRWDMDVVRIAITVAKWYSDVLPMSGVLCEIFRCSFGSFRITFQDFSLLANSNHQLRLPLL
jgi:hypothetical protein